MQQDEAKQRLKLQKDEAKKRLALQEKEALENARLRAYEKDLLWLSNGDDIGKIEYLYNKNSDKLSQDFLNNIISGNIDLEINTLLNLSDIQDDLDEANKILDHIKNKKAVIKSGIKEIEELNVIIEEEHKRTLGDAMELSLRALLAALIFNIILPPCFAVYLFIAFDFGFIQSLIIGLISPPLVWYIIKRIPFVRNQVIHKKTFERVAINTKNEDLSKEINAHNDELRDYILAIKSNLSEVISFEVSSEQLAKLSNPAILRDLLDSLLYDLFESYPPNHKVAISSFTDDQIFLVYHKIIINRFNNYCDKLIKNIKKKYSTLVSQHQILKDGGDRAWLSSDVQDDSSDQKRFFAAMQSASHEEVACIKIVRQEAADRFRINDDKFHLPLVGSLRFTPAEVIEFIGILEIDYGFRPAFEASPTTVSVNDLILAFMTQK
jgi:hypothetical protein